MKPHRPRFVAIHSFAIAVLCTLLAVPAHAESTVRRYELPDHGMLALNVPDAWIDNVSQPPGRLPPTISFGAKDGAPFAVLITPIWPADPSKRITQAKIEEIVHGSATQFAPQSVEGKLEVKPLKGAFGSGYHVFATDKAPKPGEFKFVDQGALTVGALLATFTILTNDGQADIAKEALAMVTTARHVDR